ncbi:AEC family transporter [Bacillus chungangensis]|uniref:Permease n=1 Tax=Bacillus chungangensis TaxID=587633 RepID=A0ABT9WTJ1_9BACI|nr:AEC family transporter [Bacillus chungangensis]MDQ0176608.1 putative permease [Bacillus chungangensis]
MEFTTILSSVAVMGIMIGIGMLLRKRLDFNADSQAMLISIIVNVAMPCIIIASIFQFPMDSHVFHLVFLTFMFSVLINIAGIGIGWLVARLMKYPNQKAKEMAIVSGLGNTGFIGIPLCAILFGPKGALLAAVFDAGLDFTLWSVGVLLLQKEAAFSFRSLKAMINIPMIAIIVGLTLGYFQFQPPTFIVSLTANLASIASPLAMMYIGLLVPTLWGKVGSISKLQLGIPIILKLLLFPTVTILILSLISLDMGITQVALVQSTMPTITIASIVFTKYRADGDMAAAATIFSTLLALCTIPVMVYVGGLFI